MKSEQCIIATCSWICSNGSSPSVSSHLPVQGLNLQRGKQRGPSTHPFDSHLWQARQHRTSRMCTVGFNCQHQHGCFLLTRLHIETDVSRGGMLPVRGGKKKEKKKIDSVNKGCKGKVNKGTVIRNASSCHQWNRYEMRLYPKEKTSAVPFRKLKSDWQKRKKKILGAIIVIRGLKKLHTIYHAITVEIMAENLISSATSISPLPDSKITIFLNGSHMPQISL